ncbi:BREX system P-loop protein BrxC [Lactobacillus sp. LC28-10]|uniref:BREX system P-loop protein BrxC n=1 Tax=Secundilactobacillus angelensis TaxID=2722706 RepID=A0ABX1KZE6_9LACO|nr:BREX system P-loop protein BrxC [Secundilactobacillus angelensis]NLR17436.1 BREX system P-loop protein BrxC [Secundilactobacillus angelensis]
MKIKELFAKPIDRDIQGVIKVGQEDDKRVRQELEEYVVTRELQEQFANFFTAYEKALQGPTDDMGVWISGFFGSGKSHFLKIISYILENRQVDGQPAVTFFKDKITDPMTYNRMERAAGSDTQVILFNIDSKAKSGEKQENSVIINVFLDVFNEMQGYSDKNAWIADLERQLDQSGDYEAFKNKYKELEKNHLSWDIGRDHYSMNMGTIKDTLVQLNIKSEGDAQGIIDSIMQPYQINLSSFAKLVNDFCDKTGKRLTFMVDEVGQFVGKSEQRMLNLQTLVEELGTATHGKAWVIVTSQQAINEVTANINGQDFSKIQGRFKTRIAMSSANVDEVIKRRLLEKTDSAHQELSGVYEANAASLNNAIDFDDGPTRQKFTNGAEFAENYPFVPYQFQLLQHVLTAVRTHGSDGKHLSEGERSMLSIFQESARRLMNDEEGKLVPFSLFFEGLVQFLDHTHRIVIENARDNSTLNPDKEKNPLTLQVLKVLFMVKYLDNFEATENNIVTLMIDEINVDRIELTKNVHAALLALQHEGIVEKHFEDYIFLTDAEQDINTGIEKQEINSADITNTLQQLLFNNKEIAEKYNYPKLHNRYSFNFNRFLDGKPYGKYNNQLNIKLFTPLSDYFGDELTYAQETTVPGSLVIAMPNDRSYIDHITRSLKIKQYILSNTNNQESRFRLLIDERQSERVQIDKKAEQQLFNALESATLYVSGAPIKSKHDFKNRCEEAEKAVVDDAYRKLSYIEVAKDAHDITQLFADEGMVSTDENSTAVAEVSDYLQQKAQAGSQHSTLKSVLTRFQDIPYGYTEADTEWLVASLFKQGNIKVSLNGESISPISTPASQITEYLTKKQFSEKIAIQCRKEVAPRDLKKLREVAGDVFNKKTFSSDDAETVATETRTKVKSDYELLTNFENMNKFFPGHDILQQGEKLIHELAITSDTDSFINIVVSKAEDLLDWYDDYEERGIRDFYFSAEMQKIWQAGLNDLEIYDNSHDFIADAELEEIIQKLQKLLNSNRADNNVREINKLDQQFDVKFSQVFDAKLANKLTEIENIQQNGLDFLKRSEVATDKLLKPQQRFDSMIETIKKDAKEAKTLNALTITSNRADAVFDQLTNTVEILIKEQEPDPDPLTPPTDDVKPAKKSIETVRVRDVVNTNQWHITSEADIKNYLNSLEQQLKIKLSDTNEINVKF